MDEKPKQGSEEGQRPVVYVNGWRAGEAAAVMATTVEHAQIPLENVGHVFLDGLPDGIVFRGRFSPRPAGEAVPAGEQSIRWTGNTSALAFDLAVVLTLEERAALVEQLVADGAP